MASTWSSFAVLLIVLFRARADPLQEDDLVEKVKTIVSHVDEYIATHGLNELILPDIGVFSFDPIKLRNGGFGEFSTIYVRNATSVNKSQEGGKILYSFDLELSLDDLNVHYDFDIAAFGIQEKGKFNLTFLENSAQLIGSVSVQEDTKICQAKLASVRVLDLGDYRIGVPEDSAAALIVLSEVILNFITPKLLPILNAVLWAALEVPGVQNVFSNIACTQLA